MAQGTGKVTTFALGKNNTFQLIEYEPTAYNPKFFKISNKAQKTIATFSSKETRFNNISEVNKIIELFEREPLTVRPSYSSQFVDNKDVDKNITQISKILTEIKENLKNIRNR